MRCPYCHTDNDIVADTRALKDGYEIRRRRKCRKCQKRFVTVERIQEASIRVVKRDQTREPLDREKIRRGIERACSKRPIGSQQIEKLVQEIEQEVYSIYVLEVATEQIGEIVMRHLAKTDDVACIRFASVYREFENVNDFINMIQLLRNKKI
ncbi:MAG: NrdR family transcriptional regulator [Planctomycetota bacterium]|jgi:transcriptional repressor NrdR